MASVSLQTVTNAPKAFDLLRGIFCVYKPANVSCAAVRRTILGNLCRDLNELDVRPPADFVTIEGPLSSGKELTVKTSLNYADHPLVVGSRYQPEDIKMGCGINLGKYTSGVLLMRVNGGYHKLKAICNSNQLRIYELRGEFGKASDTHTPISRIVEKATYRHISVAKLERLLGSIQSAYQVQAFKYAGVPLNSQAAFEMAATGTVRPAEKSPTLVYNIRCVELNLPYFTLGFLDKVRTYGNLASESCKKNAISQQSAQSQVTPCTKPRTNSFGLHGANHASRRQPAPLSISHDLGQCALHTFRDMRLGENRVHFQGE